MRFLSATMTPIEQIGKDKLVETIARNMRVESDYFDDLCQEVYFILITGYTEEKLQEAIEKKQINFIITSIMKNQWFSKTSPFYRQYKKPNLKKVPMEQYKEEENEE